CALPAFKSDVHPISIELDFVQPVGAVGCVLNELGKLRFDQGRWRRRFSPSAVRDRARRRRASGFCHRDPSTRTSSTETTGASAMRRTGYNMLERQRVGIARAKAEGKYKGRKPTARNQAAEVRKLDAAGVTKVEIARRLGMHRASVYRILRD